MTIEYKIIIGSSLNQQEKEGVKKIIADTFSEADQIYNKWNPESELSKLNQLPAGEMCMLSSCLEKLLLYTHAMVELTEGRFDPTIEPLQRIWKASLEKGTIPSEREIASISPSIGWKNIHLSKGTFSKENSQTELDLGGIAKGFCVDLLVERLNAAGYPSLFVEWGGEIRASGEHPSHRPWRIFISDLGDPDPDHALAIVELREQAIATSGNYFQFWRIGEDLYFHIIDPKTLRPLQVLSEGIGSVSILANSCMIADGLATSAMVFSSLEQVEQWVEKIRMIHPEIQVWVIKNGDSLRKGASPNRSFCTPTSSHKEEPPHALYSDYRP